MGACANLSGIGRFVTDMAAALEAEEGFHFKVLRRGLPVQGKAGIPNRAGGKQEKGDDDFQFFVSQF